MKSFEKHWFNDLKKFREFMKFADFREFGIKLEKIKFTKSIVYKCTNIFLSFLRRWLHDTEYL